MNWWTGLFRRRHYHDLAVSIDEHIAEKADELIASGMSREQAERAARRAFGNRTVITERSREAWQWPTIESLWADLRFALRQLVKSPGFTATAVLTLALGIAVNGTIFSLVSAFLMPNLPERNAHKVVVVSAVNPNSNFLPDVYRVSPANFLTLRADTRVFAQTAAMNDGISGSLGGEHEQPEAIQYEAITPNYFSILGAAPALGRGFLPGEDQPGRDREVVLSHKLWARRYGSDQAIVGRTIRLNREDYTVVGVMGEDFRLMYYTPQLWTPLALKASDVTPDARKNRYLIVFSQLAPGVTLAQANAEAKRLAARAAADFPQIDGRWGASVRTLKDYLVYSFSIENALWVMMTAVGFVLLIACANVSALLLTRAAARQKELAIRASLGASRWRIVRQLLIEGLTIALIGGAAGLGLTWAGIKLLRSLLTFNEGISAVPVNLDGKVLTFALGITVLAALLSSVAPALKASRTDLNAELRSEGRAATAGRSRNRLRAVLVGGEIALALFLLAGTALLTRGIYALEHQRLGFREDHLLTAGLTLDKKKYPDAATQARFVHDLLPRLHQIAGVEDAAATSNLPSTGAGKITVHIQGVADPLPSEPRQAETVSVTPEFFAAAGIAALRGRTFTGQDDASAPRVVVVNQRFVDRYLGPGDALGRQVKLEVGDGPGQWEQIVGVVASIKSYSEETRIDPMVYEAFAQRPSNQFSLMLRGKAAPDSMAPAMRQAVASIDPELPLTDVMSMEGVIKTQRNGDPVFVEILGTFAGLALVLSAIGIYGLIGYSVRQRTHEIGIRMALGANSAEIARMVLRQGLRLAAIGSAVGLLLALPLGNAFDAMFPGIQFISPAVYPVVLALMAFVALAATLGPARRAARVDPSQALRSE
ncbi:MAG TPA: ABC transporter permease [Terracidiphilus sp.]|nr:ABC transporter permease [Terracidiphilus sp.]